MWNLIAELSLFFLIASIIGWLMGRYLCKSGEIEQRSLKNKLLKEKDLLEIQLKKRDEEYKSSLTQINESEALIGKHEQQISSLHGQLGVLNDEREQLLEDLQEFKHTKNQLSTLTENYQYEKEQHHRYREKTIDLTDQRDELVTVRNKLNNKLNTGESLLQAKTIEVESSANTINSQEAMIKQLENERDAQIAQLMAEKEREIQEIINNKNEVVQKLNNYKSSSSLQLKSTQEEHQYTQDENQKLQSKFKLINNENETIKQRLEEQNKEYSLLQEKYTQLNEESISFDQKLKKLTNKNNELRHSIEVVTIENNDYLGRLRAISSVVDVVGTEPNRIISLESAVN